MAIGSKKLPPRNSHRSRTPRSDSRRLGVAKHLRLLDQHAPRSRVLLQNGCEQRARASADIDHRLHAGPVVRAGDLLVFVTAQVGQGPVEHLMLVREAAHAIPERLPIHVLEARLAGLHAVAKLRRGLQYVFTTPEEHGVPEAARPVTKEVGDRIVGKHPRRDLLKGPECRQRAQRPGQGERMQSGPPGQFRCGKRTGVEMVRHTALQQRPEGRRQVQVRQQAEGGPEILERGLRHVGEFLARGGEDST